MNAAALDPRVEAERIRALYANVPAAFVAAMTVSLYLVGTAWQHVGHATALGWLGLMLVLQWPRFAAYFAYRRAPQALSTQRWARRYGVFIGLSGAAWALSPFLFMRPGDPITHAMVMMGMYGLGAGVVPGLAYLPRVLRVFLLLVFVPLVVQLALLARSDGAEYAVLAVATLLFMGVLLGFGRNTARTLEEGLRMRFENLDLLAQLRREKDVAENASRAKSRFFAAASHDLRQPLHALGLYASALHDSATPTQRDIVCNMRGSVRALESLFDELLDISRIDAGVLVPQTAHFPATPLFEALRAQFSGEAADKGLSLRVRALDVVLLTDRTLLARVLGNLVSNAVRYTAQGSVLLTCRRRGTQALIQVWDSGCGIPAEEQDRVFEEFHQLQNPERDRRKGLGLGLATVRRLCALLELPLTLRSRVGRGSVFTLQVPLGTASAVLPPPVDAPLRDVLAGRRIVVIDDDLGIRDSMRVLMTQWHCEVCACATADEALALLGDARPDLVIADYRLAGGVSGADAVRMLQAVFGATLPALLISGDTAPERIAEARSFGWPLLHKPVRAVQLRASCSALLGAHEDPVRLP